MSSFNLEVEGATLYGKVEGSESHPALLLWPPGSCNLRVWDHLIPDLCARFRVIRVDIRGYGQSVVTDDRDECFTFEQYAEDACTVLDYLNIDQCHSWSQSWGSRPAMVFAANHANRVISTALYAANVDLPNVAAQREGTRLAAKLRKEKGIQAIDLSDEIQLHLDQDSVSRTSAALRKFQLSECVPKLHLPVLIATGSHDPNLISSRVIAAQAPNARLVVLDAVGHNGILEHPKLALNTFLDFHDELCT